MGRMEAPIARPEHRPRPRGVIMGSGSGLGAVTRRRRATATFVGLLVTFSFVLGQVAYASGPELTAGPTAKQVAPAAAPAAASSLDGGRVSLDFIAAVGRVRPGTTESFIVRVLHAVACLVRLGTVRCRRRRGSLRGFRLRAANSVHETSHFGTRRLQNRSRG